MRESQALTRNQTLSERMRRIKRNVQIRKEKLYGVHFHSEESTESEQNKQQKQISKEDKNYMQKLKNRQAAQKSRQQKKFYTSQLQEEIKKLKNIMSQCHKCRHQVENSHSEVDNTRDDSDFRQMNEVDSVEDEIPESQNSFYRMRSNSQDSSIGIYLFIFMIIIGVFCMGTRFDSSGSMGPLKRDLMQVYNSPKNTELNSQNFQNPQISSQLQPIHSFDMNMNPTYSTHSEVNVDPSKYQNGLLSMDQVKSPASISDDKVFDKIITAFENYKLIQYDDKNLRSRSGLIDGNKSLMFCTRPKIYKGSSHGDGIMTTFLDIFVQGIEIVNILSSGESHSLAAGNLQLDGLYKITASVEQIEEIPNPNLVY